MSFGKRTFEGLADNKSRAEAIAAHNAVEFIATDNRKRLLFFIARKIASGMSTEERESTPPKVSLLKTSQLKQVTGTSCSYTSLLKCLTLKADVLPYSLSHSATNEILAFCGSSLAMAFAAEKSPDQTGSSLSLPQPILDCVKTTRHDIFRRSRDDLSNAQYLDVIQAIIYCEFLHTGYVGASKVFDRSIFAFHKGGSVSTSKPFSAGIPYTQYLQEFAQQYGVDLPTYHYILTNPSKPHAPIFRCRASYSGLNAEALANSKKVARQKASYELLKKLEEKGG
jgi:dsRNA-specific ribonuclease